MFNDSVMIIRISAVSSITRTFLLPLLKFGASEGWASPSTGVASVPTKAELMTGRVAEIATVRLDLGQSSDCQRECCVPRAWVQIRGKPHTDVKSLSSRRFQQLECRFVSLRQVHRNGPFMTPEAVETFEPHARTIRRERGNLQTW